MTTNQETIEQRLEKCRTRWCDQEKFEKWYALDFENSEDITFLDVIASYSGTEHHASRFREGNPPQYNRWHFEVFLQRQELVSIRCAAAELAISVDQLRVILELIEDRPEFTKAKRSHSVLWKNFLRDFHKSFGALRRTIFSDHPNYISRLHQAIRQDLDMGELETVMVPCEFESSGDEPARPQYYFDCLTDEPVALGWEVFLDTGKPMELALDVCSWKTFSRHESLLTDVAHHPRMLTSEIKMQLRDA